MIKIQKLTFNPFQENTYVLYDETKECVIIDPGCYEKKEQDHFAVIIEELGLKPVKLLNTHGHIDHVLGNYFVAKKYNIDLFAHKNILQQLEAIPTYSKMYGFDKYELSPEPCQFLEEGDTINFGNSKLEIMFCPGHAPDHIVFYQPEQNFIINGDVLFQGSFGRTDLPGGDFNQLKSTILNKMFELPEETVVYTGHGGETTIGKEKTSNPIRHMSL